MRFPVDPVMPFFPAGINWCDLTAEAEDCGVGILCGAGQFQNFVANINIDNNRVLWTIPTLFELLQAVNNGIENVMPPQPFNSEWTATTFSFDRSRAWTFDISTHMSFTEAKSLVGPEFRCMGGIAK